MSRAATDQASATATGARSRGLVLVVEDEPAIADVIRLNLSKAGFGVHVEHRGDRALDAVARLQPAAIILDVTLPGLDGIEICRALRAEQNWTPVIFVTARDDEVDRVIGLELGADDYVTKPFSPRELVARVGSVLRRAQGTPGTAPQVVGAITLDAERRRVFADGDEAALTVTEFDLLAHLMRSPGRVFSREQLLSMVWGYSAVAGTRTVDVHIAQLRAKLGAASPIRTVRGVGYAAEGPATPGPATPGPATPGPAAPGPAAPGPAAPGPAAPGPAAPGPAAGAVRPG